MFEIPEEADFMLAEDRGSGPQRQPVAFPTSSLSYLMITHTWRLWVSSGVFPDVMQQTSIPALNPGGRKIGPFLSFHSVFFSFCHRTLGGLEMTRVCCLSNSSTKCCFPITVYLGNSFPLSLSWLLETDGTLCLKFMSGHFNRQCPVIWDSRPDKEVCKNAFDG